MSAERLQRIDDVIELCVEERGDAADPTVLLVAGLGQQLIAWPDELCDALVSRGLRVVRFDNRDAGRSTHMDTAPPTPVEFVTRRWDPARYSLDDMACDTWRLMQALDLDGVHLVGMSMGGMIAQNVASRYPDRVGSLTSIMSTTGAKRIGRPAPSTWRRMLGRPPADREAAIAATVSMLLHIGSHGFAVDEAQLRAVAQEAWDRGAGPTAHEGVARQLAAIFKSGDRTALVREIAVPTLVVHGDRDRMVHPSGGAATAAAIPGARLHTILGMGHDLPPGAWPELVDVISAHVLRAAPVAV